MTQERKPLTNIWTDAGFEENNGKYHIGCAAFIQNEASKTPLIIAGYLRGNHLSCSTAAEVIAIAMALKFVGKQTPVHLKCDSSSVVETLNKIINLKDTKQHLSYLQDRLPNEISTICEHDALSIEWASRDNSCTKYADEFAGYARKYRGSDTRGEHLTAIRAENLKLDLLWIEL